ncbi:MAG: ERF family protein [Dehalococcoidia bacterium]|jgi:hypothetical protein
MESKLLAIQAELRVPKGQMNAFGGYKYRSCEDILEAVKPLLKKHGLELTLPDEIINLGTRYYVKATAVLTDGGKIIASVPAYAREEDIKKGMDAAQITGSASSYARKYALNGLFLIDDTKDPDATNRHGRDEKPTPARPEAPKTPIKPKTYIGKIDDVTKGVSPTGKNFVCLVLDGEKCYIAKGSPEEAEGDCQMFGDLMDKGLKVKAEVVPAGAVFEITKIEEA